MSGYKCVVFDVDDTLYLERDYAHSGFSALGRWLESERGVSGFGGRAWELFEAGARGDVFNRALASYNIEARPELIKEMVRLYRTHTPDIALQPDARDALEALSARYRLAALTGGPPDSQRAKVRALNLERYCDPIVYAGQWGREFDKPHERPFLELERLSGFSGSECIYISDNPAKDFHAPLKLGWGFARVRRPGGIYESIEAPQDIPLREFTTLTELIDALL